MPRHASFRSCCAARDGRHGALPIEILTATRDDALMLAERVRRHFTCVLGGDAVPAVEPRIEGVRRL
ncbi:hypothetical protein CCHR01_18630 [Colletotrichum chrysophilum]|uniref:Uncharacterized protein n=1 Tax=Colletotrichum chrysophilum TaxID=1836956 RepID=A0AAD9A0D0_9PEZI|nr:hypothetical protein CCHR01_18630 [Colletotrichum chrysophilum]